MKILTNKAEIDVESLNPSIVMMNFDISSGAFHYEKYAINSRKELSLKGVNISFKTGYSNNNNISLDLPKDAELFVMRKGLNEEVEENRLIKETDNNPLLKFKKMKAKDILPGDFCLRYKVKAGNASVESLEVLSNTQHTDKMTLFKVKSSYPLIINKFIVFFP